MMILDETRSHWTAGPFGKKGNDYFDVAIPNGQQYQNTELTIIEGGGARLEAQPSPGQTGVGSIKVHWWYNGFGKIRYNLKAYSEEIPTGTDPSEATLYVSSPTMSHYTGFVFGKRGYDDLLVTLPGGYSFTSVELVKTDATMGSGARIDVQPRPGSVGSLFFKVHWWYNGFGKIRYYLRVKGTANSEYGLTVSSLSWQPNPAIAGAPLTLTAQAKNTGTVAIATVVLDATVYAKTNDDAGSLIGLATDEQRTQKVVSSYSIDAQLAPGETKALSLGFLVPASFSAMGRQLSTAGTYRMTIQASLPSGEQLTTYVVDNFRIAKA